MTRSKSDIKTKHVAGVGSVNLTEDEIESIWSEQQTKEAEVAELAKTQYQRDRIKGSLKDGGKDASGREIMVLDKPGYASIGDQLDMIYKDQLNGTTTWKDHVSKVKSDHPKD
tara:strand:+ start:294 stop:632 length:339 start_codon:yes stop_codon:yes gene_type:complete